MTRETPIRTLSCLGLLLATSCTLPDPDPIPLIPPMPVRLQETLRDGTLAVIDFADLRPEVERRANALQDTFIDNKIRPPGHYWYDRGERTNTLPGGAVDGQELFLRMTGDGSFLWYPFPYVGTGGPSKRAVAGGLTDYFALWVERRGVVSKVIRVPSREAAREAGADFVLEGQVAHFAAGMTEVHEAYVERPDDAVENRLFSRLEIAMSLLQLDDEQVLWERDFPEPFAPEDPLNIFDWTEAYRGVYGGTGGPKLLRLDPLNQPRMSFEDMVAHVDRRLRTLVADSVTDIEAALGQNFPID